MLTALRVILFCEAIFLISPHVLANTITVKPDGTGDYPTIQAAIDAAVTGDTVGLELGTYTGNGNRDIDFSGKAITVRSTDPNNPAVVAATIIDCQGSSSEPHRGFYFHNAEGPNSVVDGLKIINGYGLDEEIAMYVHDPVGGGIFTKYASPTITRCVISNNQAPHGFGGGICCRGGTPIMSRCIISNNSTASYGFGGGIYCWTSSPIISNCVVMNNSSNGYGGGIYCNNNAPKITLCTITGNSALYMGGGVCMYDSTSIVSNCIIWNNTAPDGPAINVRTSIYPTVTFCDVQGSFSGQGNFNLDPCFSGDGYHIQNNSPCINTGDPCYVPGLNERDIDDKVRVIGTRLDIGIDEVNVVGPVIGVWPKQLDFTANEGEQNPETQLLHISNSNVGTGAMTWQISENSSWLSVVPNSGISNIEANEVTIIIDISEANQGLNECDLAITSSEAFNSPQQVHVSLYVYGKLLVPSRYSTIQAAIDAARNGDTIFVADGIYTGPGNRNIDFKGKAITVKSENGPGNCIIDCRGNNYCGFNFVHNEGSNSILDGVTITNAHIQVMCGGGAAIYCQNSSPVINNCIITNNSVELVQGSSCLCYGGAIYITGDQNCNPIFTNCAISDNSVGAFGYGGGIYCGYSRITMRNCLVSGNTANQYGSTGGGIYCQGGYLTISNCTIADNTSSGNGGGINFRLVNKADMSITNCIMWGNLPDQIYTYNTGTGMVRYSDIQGGWIPGPGGNMNLSPCFADLNNSDYHLKSQAGRWDPISQSWVKDSITSPCIDTGDPTSNWTAELWPHGKRVNMGAYGGTPEASMSLSLVGNIANLDNDSADRVDFADFVLLSDEWCTGDAFLKKGNLNRDDAVDFLDFAIFTQHWLEGM